MDSLSGIATLSSSFFLHFPGTKSCFPILTGKYEGVTRHFYIFFRTPGPSCSKLTTSLVNIPLKFQTLISHVCQYFLLKKCEKLLHFSKFFKIKNISVFGYKVVIHLTG